MPRAYYNEIDPNAAQWLRNLIKIGAIAPGDVDERSIEDILPGDLREYTQCHFFAGVGVWSYALRQAGWNDDRPVWTGSCPCQPFSAAGAGGGFDDERHLWPAFHHLIKECRPVAVFGEQVEAAIRHSWLDLVQTDMENLGYAFGAIGLPAAGFGAPHIRGRIIFAAAKELAHSNGNGLDALSFFQFRPDAQHDAEPCGDTGRNLGDALGAGLERYAGDGTDLYGPGRDDATAGRPVATPSCTNGFWSDADWLPFRDGKIRPVEPGTFPLVAGSATRVGLSGATERLDIPVMLKGYGNAVCAPVVQEFIEAFMSCKPV